jgi:hypothetical protein
MYANNTLLPGEKVIDRYGALTLTNKRVVGEEDVAALALGGFGRIISKLAGFNTSSRISGTATEIRLNKIDSIRLTLNRTDSLLFASNFMWFATIFLLILIWVVVPYRDALRPVIGIVGIIANLVTLGLLRDFLEPIADSLLSVAYGSYELPVAAFAASITLFIAYMMLKTIRLEIHSAKNFAFTNILDLSVKGGLEEAQKFARKVREAEENRVKK